MPRSFAAAVLWSIVGFGVAAQGPDTEKGKDGKTAEKPGKGFVERVWKDEAEKEHTFQVFIPHSYDGTQAMPLILFLHGAGEREGGRKGPAEEGLGPAIKKAGEAEFPFVVVFPRCQRGGFWRASSPDGKKAIGMLEQVIKELKIDEKRLYLTGLSMGGYGTWDFATQYPQRWAAIAPICGGGDPKAAESIKHIPCWCFHGDKDSAVPVARSREMLKALWAVGSHPNYIEYAGVGHNCWDLAYGMPELYRWFLRHRLP